MEQILPELKLMIQKIDTATEAKHNNQPEGFLINQNYSNPFNPEIVINYQLPTTIHVELKIFDMIGREVATLVDKVQSAGSYEVKFNGMNLRGGIYLYRIKAGEFCRIKKMILMS